MYKCSIAHVYVHFTYTGVWRGHKAVSALGTGVTEDYKLPCECWKLNPNPPQK